MILFPNAKINLGLDILGRRPDGYHEIATVMYPLPWRDVLEIVPARGPETTLTVSGRAVNCPVEKNLVMKAYRRMQREFPSLPPVDIYLRKVIPDGAGLGGGSADAAFALLALDEMFTLKLGKARLAEMAGEIGADCPFFIYNTPMLCTGIGTDMRPVEVPMLHGMLVGVVKPPVSVPTRDAYAGVKPYVPTEELGKVIAGFPRPDTLQRVANAFESSVFHTYPQIKDIKCRLMEAAELPRPVYVAMSGSGSAVFAIYDDPSISADNLSAQLNGCFSECEVFASVLE